METRISKELQKIYKDSNKNYDMALMRLLDSLDPEVFQRAFDIIKPISLKGEMVTIKIGDSVTKQIKDAFECEEVNENLINLLLWIAVLFPEI